MSDTYNRINRNEGDPVCYFSSDPAGLCLTESLYRVVIGLEFGHHKPSGFGFIQTY